MALATGSSGIGSLFPPIVLYLFDKEGFYGTFLIICGISLNCCVGGMLFRPFLANFPNESRIFLESGEGDSKPLNDEKGISKDANSTLCSEAKQLDDNSNTESKSLMKNQEDNENDKDNISESRKEPSSETKLGEHKDVPEKESVGLDLNVHKVDHEKTGEDNTCDAESEPIWVPRDVKQIDDEKPGNDTESQPLTPAKTVQFDVGQTERESNKLSPWFKRQRSRRESIFHEARPKQKMIDFSLLRDLRFISLGTVIFCQACVLGTATGFIMVLAMDRGIPKYKAASLLTLNGIASTVSTLTFGYILDIPFIKARRSIFYACCIFIIGATTVVNPLAIDFISFAVISVVRAVFAGIVMSQRATITADVVGKVRLRNAVGLILFATALGFLLGRSLGGKVIIKPQKLLFFLVHCICRPYSSYKGVSLKIGLVLP